MAGLVVNLGGAPSIDLGMVRESLAVSPMGSAPQRQSTARIKKAAIDFESILLGHWLEQAQESLAGAPGGTDNSEDDPARSQFQGIGMQALATALTQAGGIGLAALIRRHLQHGGGEG